MSDCLVETVESKVVVLGVDDTLPAPTVKLLGSDGGPVDTADIASVVMNFEDIRPEEFDSLGNPTYTPLSFTVTGTQVGSTNAFTFALTTQTTAVRSWRTTVTITEAGGGIYTRPTADVAVVDYNDLWGDPLDVQRLAPGSSNSEVVLAILAAEAAVRAWVTTSISSPVSERVQYAVALLASRALTAPPGGTNIVSETMGDYSVRYANTGPGGLFITDDIAELLAPWKPLVSSTYVGPDDITTELFYTVEEV